MKRGVHSTEFWITMWCLAGGAALALLGHVHDGALLTSAGAFSYAVARGVAKAGYGKAVTRPPNTRI